MVTQDMYLTDAGTTPGATGVRPDLVAEVARGQSRPAVPEAIARGFEAKRQRLFPGYAPATPQEVLEYLKERVMVSDDQWHAISLAVARDHAGLSCRGGDGPFRALAQG